MRTELRHVSAHQEPEFAVADLARPELSFDAARNRFCRVKERYVPEHLAEGRQREWVMRAGEDEDAVFLHIIRGTCARNQQFLIHRGNTEFNRAGKFGNGNRVNLDAEHPKSILIE